VDVVVGATGLEPAVSCSQSRRASHYATPRIVSDRHRETPVPEPTEVYGRCAADP
jgi:hypothetical protein